MDSPQSVVSPFKSSIVAEPEKHKSDICLQSSGSSKEMEVNRKEAVSEPIIGALEVYIHQARDIHNICIYHKQDVYAKICLLSHPEDAVSTQIINGGGRNPVFNQNLSLNVRTVETSLKCELWMLSRVKNYLEDQLLGFALVPLSEVIVRNGKLEKEFSLSSTDLFHSPAGFVLLSLAYDGASPEVMAIPAPSRALCTEGKDRDSEILESLPSDFENIEFPDPKIANENQMMVSEYFGISCSNMDSETSESLATSDQLTSEMGGVRMVESFSAATVESVQAQKADSPPTPTSVSSINGAHSPSVSASLGSSDTQKPPTEEHESSPKEKGEDVADGESASSGEEAVAKPVVSVKIPEQNVVQQDFVDMYMKSMQQFTESLAKMKLPLDVDNGSPTSGNSSSDQKLPSAKSNGSRPYYGSRAFF